MTSDGNLHIAFTRPVTFPADVKELILADKLLNVTFVPSMYDYDDDEP